MTINRRSFPLNASLTMTAAPDGWPIRTLAIPANPPRRGAILWCGGRGDIFEKYIEAFAHWSETGWSITSFDWRGQGGSGRLTENPRVGHINDFSQWIDDLAAFVADWKARELGPHVIIAHSMGGHLVLRALGERRIAVDAVVLSAPMLGFSASPVPLPIARLVAAMLARLSPTHRPAWRDNERPGVASSARQALLTHDDARYADEMWWKQQNPTLELGPPNWQWVSAAYRSMIKINRPGFLEAIDTPVLIVGTDGDRLVSPEAIRLAAARLPRAEISMLPRECAHEVLRERDGPRDLLMALIDGFLRTVAQ